MITSEKNILFVLKSSQPGGVEFHVLDLVKGFSKANRVYVMVPPGPLIEQYEKEGATVLRKYPKSSFDTKFIKYVNLFCKEKRIHIIHTHELISSQALIGAFLAGVKKRVHHVHTPFLLWKYPSFLKKIVKTFPNWLYNLFIANLIATDVIALTRSIKIHRIFFEGVLPTKIRVIANSIDANRFSKRISKEELARFKRVKYIPKNRIILGVVSRITAEKGHLTLIKAFKKLNDKFPEKYFLLIAGGGDLKEKVEKFCNLNFKSSYIITDQFSELEKTFYFQSVDYFIFPSYAEGFGYVPLEALASRIPTIVSNLPVLKDVLGEAVTYFSLGNEEDLYNKIIKLSKVNNEDKKEIVKIGLSKALEYNFDAFIKNYSAVYEKN